MKSNRKYQVTKMFLKLGKTKPNTELLTIDIQNQKLGAYGYNTIDKVGNLFKRIFNKMNQEDVHTYNRIFRMCKCKYILKVWL